MSVNGSNNFLNIEDANLRVRNGSVHAQGMTIGGAIVSASHGLQSVSDTGNTTSNTLQFTNATTAFKATSNIELTSASKIIVDSNVVTEYTGPHDRPLRKYPEVALTVASETGSGYKGYKVSTSSQLTSFQGYRVFDKTGWETPASENNNAWVSVGSKYVAATGLPDTGAATTSYVGGTATGEYVQLQLPHKIKISKYDYTPRTHTGNDEGKSAPKTVKLLGSSDNGSTWTLIKDITHTGTRPEEGVFYTTQVGATEYYDYIRFVATSTYTDGTSPTFTDVRLSQIRFYGYEEGSGSLDTTLKTVYNVPATTGTQLEVYYDAKETSSYPESGVTVTDLTLPANNGTLNGGVGFDTTYKAFTFDGTTTRNITATLPSSVTGEYVHSVSLWVKADEVSRTSSGMFTFFTIGSASSANMIALGVNTGSSVDGIKYDFFDSSANVLYNPPITSNEWMHFVVTYSGGANNLPGAKRIYLNGKELSVSYAGNSVSSPLSLPTSPTLTIGGQLNSGNPPFTGSIANFRLYSKVLNAGQVKELYDYQKDYFLGSKSQVTLYKGHLGVGVTEPSGQLELAGDERIQEYPPRDLYQYDTNIEGHGVFCASASIEYTDGNHPPWEAFSDSATSASQESTWTTNGALYDTTSGLYTGSTTTSGIKGEWIQLKTPYKIKISSFNLNSYRDDISNRQPRNFILLGSNDGNVWEQMKSVTDQTSGYTTIAPTYSGLMGPHYTINSTKYYSYFRIVVTANQGGDALLGISRIRFFGTPGPTTLDKGSLTLGRSLDVPRVSRYDVDTETPRPEKLVLDLDTTVNSSPTDISGKGNHGVFNGGAKYSAADKAFTGATPSSGFNGNTNYISGNLSGVSGAYAHTQSYWINGVDATPRVAFTLGAETGSYSFANLYWYTGSGAGWVLNADSAASATWVEAIQDNRWYHVVLTYDGGSSTSSWKFYLDGEYKTPTTMSASAALSLPSNPEYRIGRNNTTQWYNGMVSNPKVYSVALEPSEVQKLYRLGRTGRSMVISDTAVGIGKAPEAQLDVRGNLRVGGTIQVPLIITHRYITADTTVTIGNYIPFSGIIYENPTGLYNGNYFVCPIKGIYECVANLLLDNGGSYDGNHTWLVNGSETSPTTRGYATASNGNRHKTGTSHYYLELNPGDTIGLGGVSTIVWYGASGHRHSHMSIRLITPT